MTFRHTRLALAAFAVAEAAAAGICALFHAPGQAEACLSIMAYTLATLGLLIALGVGRKEPARHAAARRQQQEPR